jgi:hypothetical protein
MTEQQDANNNSGAAAKKKKNNGAVKVPKEGITELGDAVYQLAAVGKQAAKYTKTTKAIAEYVGREYGYEMRALVLSGKDEPPVEPKYPEGSKPSEREKAVWSKHYDLYLKKLDRYQTDKAKVFTIVLGQCEKAMKHRIECFSGYESLEKSSDVAGLLAVIKKEAFDANDKKYSHMQAVQAWKSLSKAWQGDNEDLMDYYRRFVGLVETVESAYGPIEPLKIAKNDAAYASNKAAVVEKERGQLLACMFMDGANTKHYGQLMKDLADDFALGQAKYPASLEEALQVLSLYHKGKGNKGGSDFQSPLELTFAQHGSKCWKCGEFGHLKRDCPKNQGQATRDVNAAQMPWQV